MTETFIKVKKITNNEQINPYKRIYICKKNKNIDFDLIQFFKLISNR